MGCWMTTPTMWPPAAASQGPDLAGFANSQPTGAWWPLVEVLVTPDCPHRDAAIALARRVCERWAGRAEVRVVQVAGQPAAEQARFLGSPTIGVNGRDIEPGAEWNLEDLEFVHGCRLYQGAQSLQVLPEEDWLRQALDNAEAQP
jgi:hypothetical protein